MDSNSGPSTGKACTTLLATLSHTYCTRDLKGVGIPMELSSVSTCASALAYYDYIGLPASILKSSLRIKAAQSGEITILSKLM